MEQLIHAFGIDIRLITIQMINFVVLLGLLSYFLYKPVFNLLAQREETIKKGIADAEEAAQAKALATQEKQEVLTAAQKEAGEITARAEGFGKERTEVMLKEAAEKAAHAIKDAEAKSALLKAQAIKESEAEIARLAILAAEKVLQEKAS